MTGSLDSRNLKNVATEFLDTWDWQWYATLTFPEHIRFSEEAIHKFRKQWTRKLCTNERIRIGYAFVLSYKSGLPHLHLLMVGRGKKHNHIKTLRDVSPDKWETEWPFKADIQNPDRNIAVSGYLAGHLNKSGYQSSIDWHDIKLIKQLKRSNNHGHHRTPESHCIGY